MKIQIAIGASTVVACACSLATAQVDSPSPYTSEFRFPAQPDWVEGEQLTAALGDSYVIPNGMMFGEGADFWFGNSADDKSIPDIDGTEVDFVKEGLNEAFRFRNPNVTGECGCGESFSV